MTERPDPPEPQPEPKRESAPHPASDGGAGGDSRTEDSDPLAGEILRLVEQRGSGKSICPSEVARAFAEQRRKPSDPPDLWRRYMAPVRQQAKNLARQGRIAILRRGKPVDPNVPVKGVIRLSVPVADGQRDHG